MKKVQQIWEASSSGILLPAGTVTDISSRKTTTYLNVKARAEEIERLYSCSGLAIPQSSDLASLIENAKLLWEKWFTNRMAELNVMMLFKALHLDRIAEAILSLEDVSGKEKYLKAISSGTLDFFKREKSHAKNIFWEVELWSRLRRKLPAVRLCEPPDVIVDFDDSKIGIACKKLYSEKHVQNVLSEAVSQIGDSSELGIVAVNIDDLTPPNKLLKAPDFDKMARVIIGLNGEFLRRHERHFRKYLASGRLISAVVSTSVIADVSSDGTRMYNAMQWTVWTIPGLTPEKSRYLQKFYDFVMQ